VTEHEAFYATAAQVIPVLLLVLVLETRLFASLDIPKTRAGLWIGRLLFAALFAIATMSCFSIGACIASLMGNGEADMRSFIQYTIYILLTVVVAFALVQSRSLLWRDKDSKHDD
jgi:hypothetical protein